MVGGPGRADLPLIQSAKVTPRGASHSPSGRRTHSSSVSSTRLAHGTAGRPVWEPAGRCAAGRARATRRAGTTSTRYVARAAPASSRTPRPAPGPGRAPPPSGARRPPPPRRRTPARRRWAHPAAAPRADPVEAVLHGAVAREVEHAARRPQRIRGERGDGEAIGVEPLVQVLGVGGDGSDEGAEGASGGWPAPPGHQVRR